ncbi:tripartite tricarboxylate transporter permease [Falsirhodobacter deserti]|uniref:tripartite tricarboxylate transporter permease n=1 Tax=Falsirhodobacter deserti TaxID=1365611 RepID=UPI000FE400BE|nr:tripartite tricarboxylate transporter permease [Falsirhodobacter deserti]
MDILISLSDPALLLTIVVCTLYGSLIGALPGLSATMAVALLVPFTFYMDPVQAITAIVATTSTAIFAGDISGALLRIPGTPASAAYVADSATIAHNGRPRTVLFVDLFTSAAGGIIGVIVLSLATPMLARFATNFSSYEMFWLAALGLSCAVFVAGASPPKTFASLFIGLAIACVGIDVAVGMPRYTFGFYDLFDGVDFISAMIGFFALTELFRAAVERDGIGKAVLPTVVEPVRRAIADGWKISCAHWKHVLRSSPVGVIIGVLPGAGSDVAAWVTYALSRKLSKTPEKYGNGHMEGIIDAGSSNNAAVAGAWTPALVFGIPGDSVTAIAIGVLMMKGLAPGPDIFERSGDVVYTLFGAFLLSNVIMVFTGGIAILLASQLLRMPRRLLMPLILGLSLIGGFAVMNSVFSIWIIIALGVLGYLMILGGIPIAPAILGVVLGKTLEQNFMTSMIKSQGEFLPFFSRDISMVLGVATILIWGLCLLQGVRTIISPGPASKNEENPT